MKNLLFVFICLFIVSVTTGTAQYSRTYEAYVTNDVGDEEEYISEPIEPFMINPKVITVHTKAVVQKFRGSGFVQAAASVYLYYYSDLKYKSISSAVEYYQGLRTDSDIAHILTTKGHGSFSAYIGADTEGYARSWIGLIW